MTEETDIIKRIRAESLGGDVQGLLDALMDGIVSLAARVSNSNRD